MKNIFDLRYTTIDKIVFLAIYLFEREKICSGRDIYDKCTVQASEACLSVRKLTDAGILYRHQDGYLQINHNQIAPVFENGKAAARYAVQCSTKGWGRVFLNAQEKLIYLYLLHAGKADLETLAAVCYAKDNARNNTFIKNTLANSKKIGFDGIFYRIKG